MSGPSTRARRRPASCVPTGFRICTWPWRSTTSRPAVRLSTICVAQALRRLRRARVIARSCARSFVNGVLQRGRPAAASRPCSRSRDAAARAADTKRSSGEGDDARRARRRSRSGRGARTPGGSLVEAEVPVDERRRPTWRRTNAPTARNVPNGSAYFMSPRPEAMSSAADERPEQGRKARAVSRTSFQPRNAPIIASSLTSPMPSPSCPRTR